MKTLKEFLEEAKATYCGRCGTTHVPPAKGGTCPALKEDSEQLKEETVKRAPGSFEHFKHHVQAAGKAEEHEDHEAMWKHHDELQKHYKPDGSYSRGTGLLDVDFGDHKSSDAELRRHYAKTVVPKSAAAKKNYK